ncbi:MAG: hypothetical protein QM703_23420 [Gemmatales bacterium]
MAYTIGEITEDHPFLLPSGEPIRLSQLAPGKKLILIFYRHLM